MRSNAQKRIREQMRASALRMRKEAQHLCMPSLNPLQLLCTCKGFRHHCICSHVLGVSHLLKGIDLKKELQELSKRREAHRPRDARGARQIQPDDGVDGGAEGEAGEQDCEMD